jgi:hypothetical protein
LNGIKRSAINANVARIQGGSISVALQGQQSATDEGK